MINDIIDCVFNDALRTSLKKPARAVFFIKVILAQRKAAKVRAKNEEDGIHVPPVMIFSVTNKCNLRCAGCYFDPILSLRYHKPWAVLLGDILL